MIIRNHYKHDDHQIEEIHKRFFKDEFDLDEYDDHSIGKFVVVDDNAIIAACSVNTILEIGLITNKDYTVRERQKALLQILQGAQFTAGRTGYKQLHAFIQDEQWLKHLLKYGFIQTKGKSLVIGV